MAPTTDYESCCKVRDVGYRIGRIASVIISMGAGGGTAGGRRARLAEGWAGCSYQALGVHEHIVRPLRLADCPHEGALGLHWVHRLLPHIPAPHIRAHIRNPLGVKRPNTGAQGSSTARQSEQTLPAARLTAPNVSRDPSGGKEHRPRPSRGTRQYHGTCDCCLFPRASSTRATYF